MTHTYVLLGFGVAVLAAWGAYSDFEAKRREAFRQLALRLGLSFEAAAKQLPEEEFGPLPLFTRGHSKRAKNVLRGSPSGGPLALFDYHYTTGSGKNRSTSQHTVIVFRLQGNPLPWFTMAPEHVFHRLGAIFGYHDIDFPHQEEFSRTYFLRGKDEQAIRALFQPPIVAALARTNGWVLEGGAQHLLIYRPGKRVAPDQARQFLDETGRIAQLFA